MTTALLTNPTTIDWPARQRSARIPFQVVDGLPVNPVHPDLPAGQGELRHLGERACADAAVFGTVSGLRWLLLGLRGDGHGWAIPGGGLKAGETDLEGGLRELHEETGLRIDPADQSVTLSVDAARYVPDPRAARNAWMVTTLIVADLGERPNFPPAAAGSDLQRVAWFPARSLSTLQASVERTGPAGKLFAAHRQMLTELLGDTYPLGVGSR
jgi:ADP-ribose pyrophosphatase